MNAQTKVEAYPLARLREPFPAHQISKLPKPYKKDSPKGKCNECGGYHGLPAVHLDYVGHAALTDRLLDTDPEWNWEPMGLNPDGTPALDANGGLWIKLTVCGVTRPGYGCADGKRGGDAMKEIIGDALRNAAMRFGAALDLWHKGDLHADEGEEDDGNAAGKVPAQGRPLTDAEWAKLVSLCQATTTQGGEVKAEIGAQNLKVLTEAQYTAAVEFLETKLASMAKAETDAKAKEPANA